MKKPNKRKKLNPNEYLEWLDTYLSILEDYAAYAEKQDSDAIKAVMVSFLRIAEHSFNHFINHRNTYERCIRPEERVDETGISASHDYNELKNGRDKVADRIATIIETDPKITKRFKALCDNLKNPRALGCCL
jgi:hypothetical protein